MVLDFVLKGVKGYSKHNAVLSIFLFLATHRFTPLCTSLRRQLLLLPTHWGVLSSEKFKADDVSLHTLLLLEYRLSQFYCPNWGYFRYDTRYRANVLPTTSSVARFEHLCRMGTNPPPPVFERTGRSYQTTGGDPPSESQQQAPLFHLRQQGEESYKSIPHMYL